MQMRMMLADGKQVEVGEMEQFTKEQLEESKKRDLIKLAVYYGVDANKRMKKGDIIDLILEAQEPLEDELPPMSVRVKRIYDSQKE